MINNIGKKQFKVKKYFNDDYITVTLEIDFSVVDDKLLHAINSFFNGDDKRLEAHDNNILYTVLDFAANAVIYYWLENNGIISLNKGISAYTLEGWPSEGIILIDFDGGYPEPINHSISLFQDNKNILLFER